MFLTDAVCKRLQLPRENIAEDVGPSLGEHWHMELKRHELQYGVCFTICDLVELEGEQQELPSDITELIRPSRALMQSEPLQVVALVMKREAGAPSGPRSSRRLLMRSILVM